MTGRPPVIVYTAERARVPSARYKDRFVGGMPEAVSAFVGSGVLSDAREVQQEILRNYRLDAQRAAVCRWQHAAMAEVVADNRSRLGSVGPVDVTRFWFARRVHRSDAADHGRPSKCMLCGKCERECPQGSHPPEARQAAYM